MGFSRLGLAVEIVAALAEKGYARPYPIQEQAIPLILQKKDVLGIAKTGSGKTASYALPILTDLGDASKGHNSNISVLVVVPTRELAVQVSDVFTAFAKDLSQKIRSVAVFGGVAINPQMQSVHGANVVIATPGRLLELVELNALSLSEVKTLVLDEADKLLNAGFADEMNRILALLPQNRQNLLFSATLHKNVTDMSSIILSEPEIVEIQSEEESIDTIAQSAYFLPEEKKGPLLRYLIKEKGMSQVLVFTSSVSKADGVARKLQKNGINAQAIHSKKKQDARTELLSQFKNNDIQVLVATDLLARGVDIDSLPYVINYELPRSPKDFVHRIGRTGRAEAHGAAISFIAPSEEHHFKVIQKKMKKRVPRANYADYDI